jgi:uncharacterized protein YjbI with pentapeptide repeats
MKPLLFCILLFAQTCQPSKTSPQAHSSGGARGDFRDDIAQGKDVFLENQTIDEPLDFTALLPAHTSVPGAQIAVAEGAVTFLKCHFKGKVSGFVAGQNGSSKTVSFQKNITFNECTFDEEVTFRGCAVQELACFTGSTFVKKANFESADFTNEALFNECKFMSDARFQNIYCRKKANFLHTEFGKTVSFQGAIFTLDAQFGAVKSYGFTDFSTAQFNGHAFFNYGEWHGQTSFEDAWFKGRCEFLQGKFVTATMKQAWFLGKPRFEEANIDISLDLAGCHWGGGMPVWTEEQKAKIVNFDK